MYIQGCIYNVCIKNCIYWCPYSARGNEAGNAASEGSGEGVEAPEECGDECRNRLHHLEYPKVNIYSLIFIQGGYIPKSALYLLWKKYNKDSHS